MHHGDTAVHAFTIFGDKAALQNEAAVAIAAIGMADIGIDLDIDARMAECGTAGNVAGAVAGDAGRGDGDGLGCGRLVRVGRDEVIRVG